MNETRKIVLITGAAKRIGHIIALEMAKAGWDIAVHYGRSLEEAEKTVALIESMGRKAISIQADLANESEVEHVIPICIKELGVPDCVVNNASIFEYDDPSTINYELLTQMLAINLAAPLVLTKRYAEALKEQPNKKGLVVHVLDQKLDNLNPDFFSYTLSKASDVFCTTIANYGSSSWDYAYFWRSVFGRLSRGAEWCIVRTFIHPRGYCTSYYLS